MNNFIKHLPHYLPLLGVYTAGVVAFVVFSFDRNLQMAVAIVAAVSHVLWGALHHKIHGDLSIGIVLEYFAFSALGLLIIFSLITQA